MTTRNIRISIILISVLLMISGCAKRMVAPPSSAYSGIAAEDSDTLRHSLFKGDLAVLSNEEIDTILNGKVSLLNSNRLVVLGLTSRNILWSPIIADIDSQNSERLLQELRSSPKFNTVRYLPSLLIPEKQTVPYLREAAARFQADLLLVYTAQIETFRKYRVFGDDEVRARCIAESLLMDVRTGIVMHSARASENLNIKKADSDLNFDETAARARVDATGKALLSLAKSLVSFVDESQ